MNASLLNRGTRTSVLGVAALATLSLVIAACGSSGGAGNTGSSSGDAVTTLTIAEPGSPTTMNPEKLDNGGGDVDFADLAYDPLVRHTPDGKWVGDLAESWTVTDSNKTLTMKIRPKVQFSDGATLTAQDVVDTIQAEKNAGTTCASYISSMTSVETTAPLTVVMKFSSPQADVWSTFDQNGMCGDIIGKKTSGTETDGTGPYMLDSAHTVTGSTYVYVQNPHFWNKGLRRYKTVTLKVIANSDSAFNALRSGQVDEITGDSTQLAAAKSAGLDVYTVPSSWQALWLTDFGGKLVPALANQKVRQAIAYAIDRPTIAKAIYGGTAKVNDESVIEGYQGFVPADENFYTYDPAKAKQLLADAGYAKGFTLPIIASRDMGFDPTVQAVASDLGKVGIKVQIKEDPTHNQAVTDLFNRKYPAFVWGYGANPLPIEATGLFGPQALFNPFHNDEPYVVAKLNKANTLNGAAADKLYQEVEDYTVKQAWIVGLFELDGISFAKPGRIDNVGLGSKYPGGYQGIDVGYWEPPAK